MIDARKGHLTAAEFVGFVLEDLKPDMQEQVDHHLEGCEMCAKELEAYYEEEAKFPQERWKKDRASFVASLKERIRLGPLDELRALLKRVESWLQEVIPNPDLPELAYCDTRLAMPIDMESEDGIFGVVASQAENGDIVIRCASREVGVEGLMIRFTAGGWERHASFQKAEEGQAAAEVRITCADWESMGSGAAPQISLVHEGGPES